MARAFLDEIAELVAMKRQELADIDTEELMLRRQEIQSEIEALETTFRLIHEGQKEAPDARP